MNLREFKDAVRNDDLKEKAIVDKWKKFCAILGDLDIYTIKYIVEDEELFEMFINYEADDAFGTDGVSL